MTKTCSSAAVLFGVVAERDPRANIPLRASVARLPPGVHGQAGGGTGILGTGGGIAGVAEALITTAAGLAVAVPAVIAYNYFVGRIARFVNDMELCASEMEDLLAE